MRMSFPYFGDMIVYKAAHV